MVHKKDIRRRLDTLEEFTRPKAKLVKQSVCSTSFIFSAGKTVALVLFYYSFSITLTFYNQRFIHAFKYPLSITMTHLVTKFVLAGIVRWIWECKSGEERISLSWTEYIKRVAPPGIFSSLDIGLSNWSFEFITVSLYTMTKSTVIVFILGFSILFKLERPRCSLVIVVCLIALGLFMFTFESTQFNLKGFLLVLGASFLSGLRWTTAQIVLQKKSIGLGNPLDMMYHIQPWMILALLPLSAPFEGLHLATSSDAFCYKDSSLLMLNLAKLMAGAFLAFLMEFAEFLLVSKTSGLSLSIAGVFKEICTLGLAVMINGDQINAINCIGLLVCLSGIILHVILKAVFAEEERLEPKMLDESIQMLIKDGEANEEEDEDEIDVFNVRRDR